MIYSNINFQIQVGFLLMYPEFGIRGMILELKSI